MVTNCVNCGAAIEMDKDKCPYCGTPYDYSGFNASFENKNALGTISIAGQEYQVYLGGYDVNIINVKPGRGINGQLITYEGSVEFIFVENENKIKVTERPNIVHSDKVIVYTSKDSVEYLGTVGIGK